MSETHQVLSETKESWPEEANLCGWKFLNTGFAKKAVAGLGILMSPEIQLVDHKVVEPARILWAGNMHGYGTRSATRGNYYVKSSRLEIQKNSFSRSGTCVWNSLPLKLRHVNKSRFKKELRVSLLNILKSENEYIGVSELITRLPKVK